MKLKPYPEYYKDSGAYVVVFIDAARSGAKPGTIGWIDPGKIDSVNISTHAFSIRMVEEFLRNIILSNLCIWVLNRWKLSLVKMFHRKY